MGNQDRFQLFQYSHSGEGFNNFHVNERKKENEYRVIDYERSAMKILNRNRSMT